MLMKRRWGIGLVIFLLGMLFIVTPTLLGDFRTELLTTYMTFLLVAMGLNLVWGYTGILSIGHFAFFGIGAYTVAIGTTHIGLQGSEYLVLLVLGGSVIACLIGGGLYYVCASLKLDELFVLVTIALPIVSEKIAITNVQTFGGINGITLPYWVVPTDMAMFFRIILGVVAVIYLGCSLLIKSPFGRVLLAIRDSENRALSLGYNTKIIKVIIFGISAFIAGLGGGLYAVLTGFVSPPLLGFSHSFDAVIWMMIGGMGTLYGPIIGTIGVNIVEFYLSGILLHYWLIVIGILFIVIVIFFPEGCAGIIQRMLRKKYNTSSEAKINMTD